MQGLDPDISSAYLIHIFQRFGPITSTRIMRDPNGRSRGFGFVKFESPEDGEPLCGQR